MKRSVTQYKREVGLTHSKGAKTDTITRKLYCFNCHDMTPHKDSPWGKGYICIMCGK